ncbi:MAG: FtsX-like permease family protein [Deltaproteobacteria bacterium]|nr:FtsX-like permease family protein [Deltaproteobacteria bacterium]
MMKWIRLASRNILRNKRRSFVTLLAIGVGFAAIRLFHGYASNMYSGLKIMAIRGEGLGHLTIFKAGWLEKGKLDPEKYMFSKSEIDGVVMAPTLSGQMNAMDVQVSGVYDTGSDATNDKYMRLSFGFAQSLLDTEKADRMVVLLDDTEKTEKMRTLLMGKLAGAGIACEIKTWKELSLFYSKVRGMIDMMFLFIFCIVLVIVVMSTVNTMGMAVMERTREIGTLRALGLKRRGVSFLFAMEGGILGLLGSLIGVALHTCVWAIIRGIRPTYTPPGVSNPVPLTVTFVPDTLALLGLCLIVLSLLAAITPARGAAKQNIVNALGHA